MSASEDHEVCIFENCKKTDSRVVIRFGDHKGHGDEYIFTLSDLHMKVKEMGGLP
jgi:hypothetical protein